LDRLVPTRPPIRQRLFQEPPAKSKFLAANFRGGGIDRKEVKSIDHSKVSPMPPMLLSMLTKEEILDLFAYALSAVDKDNAMFRK
jgi:hypothetical protein